MCMWHWLFLQLQYQLYFGILCTWIIMELVRLSKASIPSHHPLNFTKKKKKSIAQRQWESSSTWKKRRNNKPVIAASSWIVWKLNNEHHNILNYMSVVSYNLQHARCIWGLNSCGQTKASGLLYIKYKSM